MGRWVDKQVEENGKIVDLKQLRSLGRSWVLILPKPWVKLLCRDYDGERWVEVRIGQDNSITLIPR